MSATSVFETASTRVQRADGEKYFPPYPDTPEDLGIPQNVLINLMLKMVLIEGETTLSRLSSRLKLHPTVCTTLFEHLRKEQYVEVKGMQGNDYRLALTTSGRSVAQDRYSVNQYVGPAPVTLDAYSDAVRTQTTRMRITRERLREVFYDLVITDDVLDQLGPAIQSNSQIFLYGSTGNGKTSIAERLVRVFEDDVYLPYAFAAHIASRAPSRSTARSSTSMIPSSTARSIPSRAPIRAGFAATAPPSRSAAKWCRRCWNSSSSRPWATTPRRSK